MLDSRMYYTLVSTALKFLAYVSQGIFHYFLQWIYWQLLDTLAYIFVLNMPQWQYERQSVYFSLLSYRSYWHLSMISFFSVYYVIVHYVSLETLARYTLDDC